VISTISNTGTLTLPTSTDTLIARTTTDTLTNKTLIDGTNTIRAQSIGSVSIAVSGTPAIGNVLTATSTSAANWQAAGAGISVTTLSDSVGLSNTATKLLRLDGTLTTGSPNKANLLIGDNTYISSFTGSHLIAIGNGAGGGFTNLSDINSVFIGESCGGGTNVGKFNTGIGNSACNNNAGQGCVALGFNAGSTANTSDNTICIGQDTQSTHQGAVVIGFGAISSLANQLTLGGTGTPANAAINTIVNGRDNICELGSSSRRWARLYTPLLNNGGDLILPTSADTLVGRITTDTLTNKTMTTNTNNVIARSLWNTSGSGSVSTYASAAPVVGNMLVATSATNATWQNVKAISKWDVFTVTNSTRTTTFGEMVCCVAESANSTITLPPIGAGDEGKSLVIVQFDTNTNSVRTVVNSNAGLVNIMSAAGVVAATFSFSTGNSNDGYMFTVVKFIYTGGTIYRWSMGKAQV